MKFEEIMIKKKKNLKLGALVTTIPLVVISAYFSSAENKNSETKDSKEENNQKNPAKTLIFGQKIKNGKVYDDINSDRKILVHQVKISVEITPPKDLIFIKTDETIKDKNDGTITVANEVDAYSKLQYKLKNDTTWSDVPADGRIKELAPGTYQFQWVGRNNGEWYVSSTDTSYAVTEEVTIGSATKIPLSSNPTFRRTGETVKGGNDGTTAVNNGIDTYSQLQYNLKSDNRWINVPDNNIIKDLAFGTYIFQKVKMVKNM